MAAFVLLSDERLADLARAGSDKAFAAIFRRHHQALYRYCRGLLRSDEDAADALQNTFVQALKALPDEQRTIALKPWLYRVAHNEAISIIRQRRTTSELDAAAGIASHAASEHADQRERLRELLSDLDELAERQRAALLMRELGGLGVGEIATALDTTTQAASQAIYDARKALNEFALGRAMRCAEVELAVSARDGRRLKSRPLRAHLRRCDSCRAFQTSIMSRRASFAQLAPDMPAAVAGSILAGVLGSGAAGAGVAATLTATGVSIKITALAAAAGLVGTGGYVALTENPRLSDPSGSAGGGGASGQRAAGGASAAAGSGTAAVASPGLAAAPVGVAQAQIAGASGAGTVASPTLTPASSGASASTWRRARARSEFGIGATGIATPADPPAAAEPVSVAAPEVAAPASAPAPLLPTLPAGMATEPSDIPAPTPGRPADSKPDNESSRTPGTANGNRAPSSAEGASGGGQTSGGRPSGSAGRGEGRAPSGNGSSGSSSGSATRPNSRPGASNGRGAGGSSSQGGAGKPSSGSRPSSGSTPNGARSNARGKAPSRSQTTTRATAPAPQVTTPAPAASAPAASAPAVSAPQAMPSAEQVAPPAETGQPNARDEGPATGAANGHGHG